MSPLRAITTDSVPLQQLLLTIIPGARLALGQKRVGSVCATGSLYGTRSSSHHGSEDARARQT
eukprot:14894478-Alexandrium_andersonii.AAC.1